VAKRTVTVGLSLVVIALAVAGLKLRFPMGWPPAEAGPRRAPPPRTLGMPRRLAEWDSVRGGDTALCLLLDTSGSMKGEHKLADAIEAIGDLLRVLRPEDDFGLVAYANTAEEVVPLGRIRDPEAVRLLASGLRAGGATNLSAALRLAEAILDGSPKQRLILILTDGLPNRGVTAPELLIGEAFRLHDAGIEVSAVGLGVNNDAELLARMASAGGGEAAFCKEGCCLGGVFAREMQRAHALAGGAAATLGRRGR
jgi:uncharacterized protein YegL